MRCEERDVVRLAHVRKSELSVACMMARSGSRFVAELTANQTSGLAIEELHHRTRISSSGVCILTKIPRFGQLMKATSWDPL